MIAFMAPPGAVFGHTATVEKAPAERRTDDALLLCAVFNSFTFDWLARQKAATHLSLYILEGLPVPSFGAAARAFLAHGALALSTSAEAPRGALRARIDAAVAATYGLDRDGYAHILGSFSHRSWPEAPAMCLDAFDRVNDWLTLRV
jgi:hypothetical protein